VKRILAWIKQRFHGHDFSKSYCKFIHLTGPIWPFKDPLLKICSCGATRIVENK
jgi:hypothetical protein